MSDELARLQFRSLLRSLDLYGFTARVSAIHPGSNTDYVKGPLVVSIIDQHTYPVLHCIINGVWTRSYRSTTVCAAIETAAERLSKLREEINADIEALKGGG